MKGKSIFKPAKKQEKQQKAGDSLIDRFASETINFDSIRINNLSDDSDGQSNIDLVSIEIKSNNDKLLQEMVSLGLKNKDYLLQIAELEKEIDDLKESKRPSENPTGKSQNSNGDCPEKLKEAENRIRCLQREIESKNQDISNLNTVVSELRESKLCLEKQYIDLLSSFSLVNLQNISKTISSVCWSYDVVSGLYESRKIVRLVYSADIFRTIKAHELAHQSQLYNFTTFNEEKIEYHSLIKDLVNSITRDMNNIDIIKSIYFRSTGIGYRKPTNEMISYAHPCNKSFNYSKIKRCFESVYQIELDLIADTSDFSLSDSEWNSYSIQEDLIAGLKKTDIKSKLDLSTINFEKTDLLPLNPGPLIQRIKDELSVHDNSTCSIIIYGGEEETIYHYFLKFSINGEIKYYELKNTIVVKNYIKIDLSKKVSPGIVPSMNNVHYMLGKSTEGTSSSSVCPPSSDSLIVMSVQILM